MSPETIEIIARRMVLEILLEAQESHWLKRADDFAKVGTPAADDIARACKAKASLCRDESADGWAELLALELGDAA